VNIKQVVDAGAWLVLPWTSRLRRADLADTPYVRPSVGTMSEGRAGYGARSQLQAPRTAHVRLHYTGTCYVTSCHLTGLHNNTD